MLQREHLSLKWEQAAPLIRGSFPFGLGIAGQGLRGWGGEVCTISSVGGLGAALCSSGMAEDDMLPTAPLLVKGAS